MEFKILIGFLLVGIGMVTSVFSLADILRGINTMHNFVLLILGCFLMVLGALLKYRFELDIAKRRIDEEKMELSHEEDEITKLKKEGQGSISRWKIRDLEYKVKKLESEMVNKKNSEQEKFC